MKGNLQAAFTAELRGAPSDLTADEKLVGLKASQEEQRESDYGYFMEAFGGQRDEKPRADDARGRRSPGKGAPLRSMTAPVEGE